MTGAGLFLILLLMTAGPLWSQTGMGASVFLGRGGTNAVYIDDDGDGYGVAAPAGPDADDGDPSVNTPGTVTAKYGTVQNFLRHYLGFEPGRMVYIAADGNDSTGQVNNINRPFASWSRELLQPGDIVLIRGGLYRGSYRFLANGYQGEPGHPIVFMAYPGEQVVVDDNALGFGADLDYSNRRAAWLIIDGLTLRNTSTGLGYGISSLEAHDVLFRNLDIHHFYFGWDGMQNNENVTGERLVIHDNLEHGIYLGAREKPNRDVTLRHSLIYKNGWHGFQHNGKVNNLLLEGNIIHSNGLAGISLLMGASDSTIRNNLVFNNAKQGIVFYYYDSAYMDSPADMKNNRIINNTFYLGERAYDGSTQPSGHAVVLFDDGSTIYPGASLSMDHNIFRNNILVAYEGPVFFYTKTKYAATTVIENNLIWRARGDTSSVLWYGRNAQGDYQRYDLSGFQSFSPLIRDNRFADPLFGNADPSRYYATPEFFDFDLLPSSPAVDLGTVTDAPAADLRENSRDVHPDAGCYERQSSASSGSFFRYLPTAMGGPSQISGLAVVNTSQSPAGLRFRFYSNSGGLTASSLRTLSPGQQLAGLLGEIFPGLATAAGWLMMESTVAEVGGFFLNFDPAVNIMDGAALADTPVRHFVFPDADDADVELRFVNTTPASISGTLQYINSAAEVLLARTEIVPAQGAITVPGSVLPAGARGGYWKFDADGDLIALGIMESRNGGFPAWMAMADPADAGVPGSSSDQPKTLYAPQYVIGGGYASLLDIVNLEDTAIQISVRLFGDSGLPIGMEDSLVLAPRASTRISGLAAFGTANGSAPVQGYIRLRSTKGRFRGWVRFTDTAGVRFGSALGLIEDASTTAWYAHVANDTRYFTGLAVVNPNAQAARVTVSVYDADGRLLGIGSRDVPPGGRFSKLLTELVDNLPPMSRGYFKVTATMPVLGFAAFGTRSADVLSTIPGFRTGDRYQ